ncbi:MAG: hypothetical protein IKH45_03660, partial [Neisseriaceae bacterium]|nr:hypothetical protein [Neisseriaceae bacterium]
PETFAKLVDVSSVQSYSSTSNRRHNNKLGYDFERKPNEKICHRCQFCKGFSLKDLCMQCDYQRLWALVKNLRFF